MTKKITVNNILYNLPTNHLEGLRYDVSIACSASDVDQVCYVVKFMFSKKATKIDKIFTADLTSCSKCQIVSEDFVKFCGLLRKLELYLKRYEYECNVRRNLQV